MAGVTLIKSKILQRIDSEENWNDVNPVLSSAEMVFSRMQNGIFAKIGDGRHYSDTPFIQELQVDGNMVSSLGLAHVSQDEYAELLHDGDVDPNTLYVVSSDNVDVFGQQIKNLAEGTDLSDAVNLQQLVGISSMVGNLSSGVYDDLNTVSGAIPLSVSELANDVGYISSHQSLSNYYTKSETSSATAISSALSAKADLSGIEHVVEFVQDYNDNYTAITIGSRNGQVGPNSFVHGFDCKAADCDSHAEGDSTQANGYSSHAEGDSTQANGYSSHAEGFGTVAQDEGAHAEGGYTSAFGYYSHVEGGWTSTGPYAVGAHAEGGFNRADGPISHVEGVKATSEISDFQSFVWQGTDYMPQDVEDLNPEDWNEYKAHGPGTFNINPVGGLSGMYVGETSLADTVSGLSTELIEELSVEIEVDGQPTSSMGFEHVTVEDYAQMMLDGSVLSNVVYVVSSDEFDVFGQQIKNVADGTDLSDAVNVGQLQALSAQLQAVTTQLASLSAWVVSQLSGLETIINSI